MPAAVSSGGRRLRAIAILDSVVRSAGPWQVKAPANVVLSALCWGMGAGNPTGRRSLVARSHRIWGPRAAAQPRLAASW